MLIKVAAIDEESSNLAIFISLISFYKQFLSQDLYGVDVKSEKIIFQERGLVVETVCSGEKNINNIIFKVWRAK